MIYNHVCFVVGICFAVFTLVSHTFASYFSLRQELGIEGDVNSHEFLFVVIDRTCKAEEVVDYVF